MKNIFSLLLFVVLLPSCSKKSPEARNLEVSLGGLVSESQLTGGVLVRVVNPTTGVAKVTEITSPPYVVMIADGTWHIQLVGFMGATPWTGQVECWNAINVILENNTTDVYLTGKHHSDCSAEPLAALVSSKSARWGIAKWDSGVKWAP